MKSPWFVGSFKEDGLAQILTGDASDGTLQVVALAKPEQAALIAVVPELLALLQRMDADYAYNRCEETRIETLKEVRKLLRRFR